MKIHSGHNGECVLSPKVFA